MFSFKKIIKFFLFLTILGISSLAGLYFYLRDELPDVASLKDIKWQTPMQIYSADGKLISQFGEKKRIPLTLEQTPQQLINAILATEDERFYLHFGVDPIGLARAVVGQIIGENKGGGGTITMQVARNFFLTREQTYIRKLREIFLAFHIESLLTKDEILELYLNKIELGHRAFGFGAAAQVYYGKDVNELTLAQIAVLAGLPKAPSTMNPISYPQRAKDRRSVVLQRMLVSNYISVQQYQEANNATVTTKKHAAEIELGAPYIAEMAHQFMLDLYGKEEAYTGGYKVFTTVPSQLQKAAQQAVVNNIHNYDERHGYRGAIQSLRPLPEQNKNALPSKEVLALSSEEIAQTLEDIKTYQNLLAAVVTKVDEQSATITLKHQEIGTIPWQGMSWARAYIDDNKQGPAPDNAHEILKYGDVIYVLKQADGNYKLSQLPDVSSALVAISPDNGAIKALVGGYSFQQSQFNRVTQAERQVGSNIKPFLYSAALDNNFTLASLVNDAPINEWDRRAGIVWRPKNSPEVYSGPIRVRIALAQSKNVVAVRLLRAVGIDTVINHLSKFGFDRSKLPREESLALGSASLTPLDVVTGFATFANGGFLVEPYLVDRIEDSFGNILYQANPKQACEPCELIDEENSISELALTADTSEQITDDNQTTKPIISAPRVISEQNAFLVTQALNSAIWESDWTTTPGWNGTGYRARVLKRKDIAGKTGTTNQAKDAWFSGYSRHLVATSWIGFDDHQRDLGSTTYNSNLDRNQVTGKEFGALSAQPAWITFMETALPEYPFEAFEQPNNIVSVRIDKTTGQLTNKTDKSSLFEYFISGTEPTQYLNNNEQNNSQSGQTISEDDLF